MVKEQVKNVTKILVRVRVKEWNDYTNEKYNEYSYLYNTFFLGIRIVHKYIKKVINYKDKEKTKVCNYYYYTHRVVFGIPINQYKVTRIRNGESKPKTDNAIGFINNGKEPCIEELNTNSPIGDGQNFYIEDNGNTKI
jgi:hypothetical protein